MQFTLWDISCREIIFVVQNRHSYKVRQRIRMLQVKNRQASSETDV